MQENSMMLINQLRFKAYKGTTIVYVSQSPDLVLSRLFLAIQREQGEKIARECVRLLYIIQQLGTPITAPVTDIRQSVEKLMTTQYHMTVRPGAAASRLICRPQGNAATAVTVLARLKLAFRFAIQLRIRLDQPMDVVTSPHVQLRRHTHLQRTTSIYTGQRSPVQFYRVEGDTITPVAVMNNPELPQHLREAARWAGWSARDCAILELLLASGARVTEVCEATWAGVDIIGFEAGLRLHTKGQGRLPRKTVMLTSEAHDSLLDYCTTERIKFDPLHSRFQIWNRGRAWTPSRYRKFLDANGIDPSEVGLFLSERGTPYTADAFNHNPMRKLRRIHRTSGSTTEIRITLSAHHIRHWYINKSLDEIEASQNDELQYIIAVQKFIREMGWRSWHSLIPYDHNGVATKILKKFEKKLEKRLEPSMRQHGVLDASGLALPVIGSHS